MKVIEVYGDDYAAMHFEDNYNDATFLKEAVEFGKGELEDEDGRFEYIVHTFGDVDPKFIDFIKNDIIDYDDGKHHNFFVIEGNF